MNLFGFLEVVFVLGFMVCVIFGAPLEVALAAASAGIGVIAMWIGLIRVAG